MKSASNDRLTLLAFIASILFGGMNAIGVRFSVRELAPFWGAAIRFAPASLLLFAVMAVRRLPMPKGRGLVGALIYGMLNFGLNYAFTYFGLQKAQAGMTQVILAVAPLLTLLIALAFRQESFNRQALFGSLIALAGILLVFGEELQTQVPLLYLLSLLMAAVTVAFSAVYVKTVPKSDPVSTNAVAMGAGAVVLFLLSLLFGEPRALPTRTATWIALVYLILFGSIVVFTLYLFVLKRWKASAGAYVYVLLPFVTLTASALIDHEPLTPVLLVGAVLVIAGTWYGALRPASRPSRPSAPLEPVNPELAAVPEVVPSHIKGD